MGLTFITSLAAAGQGPVVINEVLTHTDLPQRDSIELCNRGGRAVDLGGWRLADNRDGGSAWSIPPATIIVPGGYLVFDDSQFGTHFRLSALGEEVWLLGPDGAHGRRFGAALNGVSFGCYRTDSGREVFVAQDRVTLGAANSGPRIGPVVISEILYHPAGGEQEFIEFCNVSEQTTEMYEATFRLPWRVGGGVDFEFPPACRLPPGALLVIVSEDPQRFRQRYGLDATVVVLGPYRGRLGNRTDTVALYRPDGPGVRDGKLVVPQVLVDAVSYKDRGAWPRAAAGAGASLQRQDLRAYGDEAKNWRAGVVGGSPGRFP